VDSPTTWDNSVPHMISIIVTLFTVLNLGLPVPVQASQVVRASKPLVLIPNPKPEVASSSEKTKAVVKSIPDVTFYSQFKDIQAPDWKKIGCGVTSLAMIIDYYKPDTVSVNTLLKQGIKNGAYLKNAGWTYNGLISLGNKYGLDGESYDLASQSDASAFKKLGLYLKDGPIIASVHYKFDPKSTIPHLVVITGIEKGLIYYNDPAAKIGGKTISSSDFLKAWKKRFIVIRPV